MKQFILRLFPIVIIFLFVFSTQAFAAGDLMSNAQRLLNDVYGKFVAFSTAGAGIGVGTGVFMRKFSMGKQHTIELGGKIIKDSIIGWGVLNGLGLILNFIAPYLQ
ncbi:MAG: hypothetical protein FIA99_04325 [Ruminiclostridium sp.]|nr:hypothetical protein [Ruminiclostridium sp.]